MVSVVNSFFHKFSIFCQINRQKLTRAPTAKSAIGAFVEASSFLLGQVVVDLLDQLVSVGAVNVAGVRDGLAARCGAAKAVHADLKEEGGGIGSFVQNVADDRILGYDHGSQFPFG